jgi:fibronectin type 3 domain-containing protein
MKLSIKNILLAGLTVFISGCVQENINTPIKPKIDENLPMIKQKSVKSISDIKAIAIEWQPVTAPEAKGYYLIRSDVQKDGKFRRIATINNKYSTHYLDQGLQPHSKYGYKISVFTAKGTESVPTDAIFFSTAQNLKSVSLIQSISNLPRQIKILWRPHKNKRVSKYIVEKTSPATQAKWEQIATIDNRLKVEYIDKDLGDNEIYSYRLKAVTFDGIVSDPSAVVIATTKPLPGQINKLTATTNLPKKIQLSWGKSKTKDVVMYNIYRATTSTGSYELIAKAPVEHNRFDDDIAQDGKIYFYKITTVDKDGLESKLDKVTPAMGATLNKPAIPRVISIGTQNNKIVLKWEPTDNRTVSYNIYKIAKDSSSKEQLIPSITKTIYEDSDVIRGVEYDYSVQAVDKNGLLSQKTPKSTIKLHKIVTKENN